jgi:hypothetical protein
VKKPAAGAPRVNPGGPAIPVATKPAPRPKPPPAAPVPRGVNPGGPSIPVGPVPRPRPKVRKRKPKVKPRAAGLMPCVAVAVARVLGLRADQVLPYCQPGGDVIGDVLESLAADGLAGEFWPAEPDMSLPGLVIGLTMPEGTHAAVTAGGGLMWSWGLAMPARGTVDEAWWALPAEEEIMQSQKSEPLAFGRVYGKVMADRAAGVPPAGQKPLAVQLGLVPDQDAISELVSAADQDKAADG